MSREGTDPPPSMLVRYGNFLFHNRNWIFPVALLSLFFAFRPVYLAGSEQLDRVLNAVGLITALAGQALRVAVIGFAYIIRGGKNRRVYAEDLVTAGLFAHSRNPLYLGNILVLLGLFLIHNNPWVYVIGVPFFVTAYIAIVAAEEAFLRGKFGAAYDAYVRDVPRWFPRLSGVGETVAGMQFNWRRVVLKEYTSTFVWTGGAVVLLAAETLVHHSYDERAGYLNALWVSLALLAVAWGIARYLKKSRRLQAAPASARVH